MRQLLTAAVTLAAIVLLATGCNQGGMMMSDDQMMDHMRSNPQMMGRMMSDPDMMQGMMNNPQMMQQMMARMMNDPDTMQQMMAQMMSSPEMMQQMAEQMSTNPEACRNMMQAMASRMDPAATQTMTGHCDAMMKTAPTGTASSPSAAAEPSSTGAQEITVDVSGTGFSPSSLNVRKGQLVRIHFKRDDQQTCADEVVFPEMNIRRKLPPNQTTTVELTPEKEGTFAFACGMDMIKGKLVVS